MDDAEITRAVASLLGELPGWGGPILSDHAGADVAVFYGAIGAKPDKAVGVRVYGAVELPGDARVIRRVQVRVRGAARDVESADRIAGTVHAVLSSVSSARGFSSFSRQSFAPLGADANGRQERTENYYVVLENTEALL